MPKPQFENILLWGVLGAAAGGAPVWTTLFYGSMDWSTVIFVCTFVAVLGASAGSLAFYTWPAHTKPVAFGLGSPRPAW
jgi:hypothetical protein